MPPVIDKKKCTNCGDCVNICPVMVFGKKENEVVVLKPGECIECNACAVNCKNKAITLKEAKK